MAVLAVSNMLTKLSVKNFAIIEDIDISFKDGLTVLTGETGAGKSLIIDSIELLLGSRANLEMIRTGEEKAIITGTFTFSNKRLAGVLDSLDIPYDNYTLVISRTISQNKGSVVKVNDKSINLTDLKSITRYLADIHQQFDMVNLLNKDNYLEIVDSFKYDLIKEYKDKYLSSLEELKEKNNEYHSFIEMIKKVNEEREIHEYELKELENFGLREDEEIEIEERITFLKNYDSIYSLLNETKVLIDKDGLTDIYLIDKNLEKLASFQGEYAEMHASLEDYYLQIEAMFDDLKRRLSKLDYSPEELEELEMRDSDLRHLKKKYGKTIPELIAYKDELKAILKSNDDLEYELKQKETALREKYHETYVLANDLSKVRKESAKAIEKELMVNLSDLALKSRFEISFVNPKEDKDLSLDIFKEDGIDDIDFLIETNVGEGLKPLAKIVSGGEMSRIMLAIKALFIKAQKIATVIFDEVDTGISGEVAQKVALKIRDISLSTQVISITHLPQVASLSNHHIKISKSVSKGRTFTHIKELTLEEKIHEIAELISGGKVTDKQLEYAKEMVLNHD